MGGPFRVVLNKGAELAGRPLKRHTVIAQCTAGEGLTGHDVADALTEGIARITAVGPRKMVKPEVVVMPSVDLVSPADMAEAVAEPPAPVADEPEVVSVAAAVPDTASSEDDAADADESDDDEASAADEDAEASVSDKGA